MSTMYQAAGAMGAHWLGEPLAASATAAALGDWETTMQAQPGLM